MVTRSLKNKHLKLDQSKIDQARRFLGAKTEQETIDQALDAVLAEKTVIDMHRKVRAVGGFSKMSIRVMIREARASRHESLY